MEERNADDSHGDLLASYRYLKENKGFGQRKKKERKRQKQLIQIFSFRLFNETCLQQELLLTYTNIRPHNPAAHQGDFTFNFRKKLITYQIKKKKKEDELLELNRKPLHLETQQKTETPDTDLRI